MPQPEQAPHHGSAVESECALVATQQATLARMDLQADPLGIVSRRHIAVFGSCKADQGDSTERDSNRSATIILT